MSPARYAWRGSLFCFGFSSRVGAGRWRRPCVRDASRACDCLMDPMPWFRMASWSWHGGFDSRWGRSSIPLSVAGGCVVTVERCFTWARGFARLSGCSAPSGWVRRGDGGDVHGFGCASACLRPRFVFQCRVCRDAFCSLPAVRSLCRWQGFARAMVGTS